MIYGMKPENGERRNMTIRVCEVHVEAVLGVYRLTRDRSNMSKGRFKPTVRYW